MIEYNYKLNLEYRNSLYILLASIIIESILEKVQTVKYVLFLIDSIKFRMQNYLLKSTVKNRYITKKDIL